MRKLVVMVCHELIVVEVLIHIWLRDGGIEEVEYD